MIHYYRYRFILSHHRQRIQACIEFIWKQISYKRTQKQKKSHTPVSLWLVIAASCIRKATIRLTIKWKNEHQYPSERVIFHFFKGAIRDVILLVIMPGSCLPVVSRHVGMSCWCGLIRFKSVVVYFDKILINNTESIVGSARSIDFMSHSYSPTLVTSDRFSRRVGFY